MCSDTVIRVAGLSKRYEIYRQPSDRLKQMLLPRLQGLFGRPRREYFREFWALRDVDFEVGRGETVGIIGQNGSGKSTLLQLVCGTLRPSSGQVSVHGRIAALLELGAGFNPEFSGRENIQLSGLLYGLDAATLARRFDDIVSFSGIETFIDQPVKTYSSGMYVRLAFAIAAHVDADVLIIDEALSVGDVRFTQKCMRFLREFQRHGTLLFVSHDTAAVTGLCDRALWLHQGRVRVDADAKQAVEAYLAEQHALVRSELGGQVRVGQVRVGQARKATDTPARDPADPRWSKSREGRLGSLAEVFPFHPDATGSEFGEQGAVIDGVAVLDRDGTPVAMVDGGDIVTLRIAGQARRPLRDLIFGFYLKDRLGQRLFGDNSYLTYREQGIAAEPGEQLHCDFSFRMPLLPRGDYSIDAAIATGTQLDHTQQHWLHDAVILRVNESTVAHGLVGIPMLDIRCSRQERS